jgi:hypothetical protein
VNLAGPQVDTRQQADRAVALIHDRARTSHARRIEEADQVPSLQSPGMVGFSS